MELIRAVVAVQQRVQREPTWEGKEEEIMALRQKMDASRVVKVLLLLSSF